MVHLEPVVFFFNNSHISISNFLIFIVHPKQ